MDEKMIASILVAGGIVIEPGSNDYEVGYQIGIANAVKAALSDDYLMLEDPDEVPDGIGFHDLGIIDGWNKAVMCLNQHIDCGF